MGLGLSNGYLAAAIDSLFEESGQGGVEREAGVEDIGEGVAVFPRFVFAITDALEGPEGAGNACGGVEGEEGGASEGSLLLHLSHDGCTGAERPIGRVDPE